MNADQLAVERAAWAVAIKQEFKFFPQYQLREHFNDYQTIFMVTRPDTPGWKAKITICSAHRIRNRLEVNGAVIGYSAKTNARHKVLTLLHTLWERYDKDMAGKKAKETEAAKWQKRQEADLAGLKELRHRRGDHRVGAEPRQVPRHLSTRSRAGASDRCSVQSLPCFCRQAEFLGMCDDPPKTASSAR